jgi:hypothetical protein
MQPGTLKFDKTIARPDAEIIEQPGQLPASRRVRVADQHEPPTAACVAYPVGRRNPAGHRADRHRDAHSQPPDAVGQGRWI